MERLPRDLFSTAGIRLLVQHTRLTSPIIEQLRRVGSTFFLAPSAEHIAEASSILTPVDLATVDPNDVPAWSTLIAAGGRRPAEYADVIEPHHREALSHGAYLPSSPETPETAQARRCLARQMVMDKVREWCEASVGADMPRTGPPLSDQSIEADTESGNPPWQDRDELERWRQEKVELLHAEYGRLLAGFSPRVALLRQLCDDLISLYKRAPAHFLQIALLVPRRPEYLPDHALGTAALCIGIAARRGWPVRDVRLLVETALLHDIGMFMLPQRVRTETEELSEADEALIRSHPVWSLNLLNDLDAVSPAVALAIYQHHERDDGSGYPEGLRQSQLSQMTQIIAVADCVAALAEPRPYREARLPHEAVQTVVNSGTEGCLNRVVVRALVEAVGLYPIGSFVHLADGCLAQVIGVRPPAADRPIVRRFTEAGLPSAEDAIDLSALEPWDLSIIDGAEPPDGEFGGHWHVAA